MTISAKIIADSVANNTRITTLELCYPRFIHAEAKTHRVLSLDDEEYELLLKQDVDLMDDPLLSRNASSSRAIPVKKMIASVEASPAMPIHWGKNQPGMQAKEELNSFNRTQAELEWLRASQDASYWAGELLERGVHKQVVNRLLEPFQYIKVIVTATEWDNFFKLRLHEDAQPEIRELARCMKEAMNNSSPVELEYGEWHLPYVQAEDCIKTTTDNFVKLSVARCARVSYLNHDNTSPNIEKDIALYDKLLASGHLSPFEHVATPMMDSISGQHYSVSNWTRGVTHMDRQFNLWSGNFRGWIMYRKLLDG